MFFFDKEILMDRNIMKNVHKKSKYTKCNHNLLCTDVLDVKQTGLYRSPRKTGYQTSIIKFFFILYFVYLIYKRQSKMIQSSVPFV